MPVFESQCSNGHVFEWYASNAKAPDPACRFCSEPTKRLISRFHAIYTGTLGRLNDSNKEYRYQTEKGHWAWRKRSTTRPDGQPEQVFLETRQDQKNYCREEQVEDPTLMPTNMEVSSDGKSVTSQGMPGSWV